MKPFIKKNPSSDLWEVHYFSRAYGLTKNINTQFQTAIKHLTWLYKNKRILIENESKTLHPRKLI